MAGYATGAKTHYSLLNRVNLDGRRHRRDDVRTEIRRTFQRILTNFMGMNVRKKFGLNLLDE